jgi:hypothetical protein
MYFFKAHTSILQTSSEDLERQANIHGDKDEAINTITT